jgi:hypothetical protein
MRPIDGGIVAVISEPTAITAEENPREKPSRSIAGPRMRASIAASATAEPDTPPISAETTIATCASLRDPAGEHLGERDDPVGDAGRVHQVAGQHE